MALDGPKKPSENPGSSRSQLSDVFENIFQKKITPIERIQGALEHRRLDENDEPRIKDLDANPGYDALVSYMDELFDFIKGFILYVTEFKAKVDQGAIDSAEDMSFLYKGLRALMEDNRMFCQQTLVDHPLINTQRGLMIHQIIMSNLNKLVEALNELIRELEAVCDPSSLRKTVDDHGEVIQSKLSIFNIAASRFKTVFYEESPHFKPVGDVDAFKMKLEGGHVIKTAVRISGHVLKVMNLRTIDITDTDISRPLKIRNVISDHNELVGDIETIFKEASVFLMELRMQGLAPEIDAQIDQLMEGIQERFGKIITPLSELGIALGQWVDFSDKEHTSELDEIIKNANDTKEILVEIDGSLHLFVQSLEFIDQDNA